MKIVAPMGLEPHMNVLLYGRPKSGKTAGACTAPGKLTLLNCDLPNASYFAHSRDPEQRITELELEQGDVMNTMIEVVSQIKAETGSHRLIETVVVDPVGELHRRLIEEASDRAIRPSLNQYGDTATHVERFCRGLCELPINTVLICHEHPVKDEATGQLEYLPWTGTTNPALGQKLLGMVDIVGYTGLIDREDGSKEYVAQLVHQGGRRGGDRFDVLGDWRALDLTEWFEAIFPKKAAPKPKAKKNNPQEVKAA